jgi:hypothetical protein
MICEPSPTGLNGSGRTPSGQFAAGNKYARGNPFARKAQQLRSALFRAVSVTDLRAIVKALVNDAKAGDVQAARLVLGYTLGDPQPFDLLERIERLESLETGRGGFD